jgi:hypothetical protein
MDSPRVVAKKKKWRDKIMKELHPECDLFIYPDESLGNEQWLLTAQLLASENPELVVLANCMLNTPNQLVLFDKDGQEILFTDQDDPDPESPNAAL